MLALPRREGLVEQHAPWRKSANERREPLPIEISRHHDDVKARVWQRQAGEVGAHAAHVQTARTRFIHGTCDGVELQVDADDVKPVLREKERVPATTHRVVERACPTRELVRQPPNPSGDEG